VEVSASSDAAVPDRGDDPVQDVIFVAILCAFFALSLVFVKACERIIGPDVEASRIEEAQSSDSQVAA
jgi:hypothetical protein